MPSAASTMMVQLVFLFSLYIAAHGQPGATTSAGVYAGQQPDSCGYGVIAPSISPHLASFSTGSPLLAHLTLGGCGACLQVTCTDPTPGVCPAAPTPLTVQIVDTSSMEIQLSTADMNAVSPEGNRLGHIDVSLQQVNCPVSGNILVRLQQLSATAGGYAKLSLLNVAGSNGITAVGFAPVGTQAFAPLKNNYGAVWEGSLPAAPPLDMQIVSGDQTLVVRSIIIGSTTPGDIPTTVQFTPAAGLTNAETSGVNATSPVMLPMVSPANMSASSPAAAPASSLASLAAVPASLPSAASQNASSLPSPAASPTVSIPNAASLNASAPVAASPNASSLGSPAASPGLPLPLLGASPAAAGASPPSPAPGSQEPLPATPANGTLFNLAGVPTGSGCSTIFDTLKLSPDLSTWVGLIQSKGLQFNLNGNNQGITMFAPINNAFSTPLLAGIPGLANAQTIGDLTGMIPDIVSDLLGYSVVPQRLLESQLLSGAVFNTTNVIKTGNGVNGVPAFIPVSSRSVGGATEVVGVGSVATLLQPNIEACGSVIHIISNALLPFNVRTLNLPTSTPVNAGSPASIVTPPTASSG